MTKTIGYPFSCSRLRNLVGALTFFISCAATAQEFEGLNSILERQRPGVEADGMPVGAMTLFPELGVEVLFNDNVFATEDNEKDDTAVLFSPEVRLNSESSRHRAELGANADVARYADFDSEDYEDYRFWATGDTPVGDGEVSAALRLNAVHEDRTSPDDARGTELTKFNDNSLYLDYTYRPGRLFARVDGRFRVLDFDSTDTPTGSVDNDDRDRDLRDFGLRVGYSLSPNFAGYGELRVDDIKYNDTFDRNGFERSSDGFQLRAGTQIDLSEIISGELYLGYEEREYDDSRFSNADGPIFGGDLTWNATGLTTVTFAAHRGIDNTTIVGASGITKSVIGVGVDHELLRNLIISVDADFMNDDFDGISREDDALGFSVGGRYLMNRYALVDFGYSYLDRDTSPSTSDGRIFTINEVFVRIVAQL